MKKRMSKEDQLVSGIMKDLRMESPSPGFTGRVMHSIQLESNLSATRPSPLISKAGWIGIAAGLCLVLVFVFLGYDSEVQAEPGWLAQRMPSINLPEVNFSFGDFFSRIYPDSPTLFWIFTGIGGIILLAFLERLIDNIRIRHFYLF